MTSSFRVLAPLGLLAALAPTLSSQVAPGHRLYGPHGTTDTFLVDTAGVVVHTWPSGYVPGNGIYMLDDGSIIRTGRAPGDPGIGGSGGAAQRIAFDGTILWDYLIADATQWSHHDIAVMPNGNYLFIVWDLLTDAEAIAAGRDPALLTGTPWLPDSILEVQPTGLTTGTVVWEWHVMDHLIQDHDNTKANFGVVADNPQLLDINYPPTPISNGDWNHANSIDYDPVNDLIVINFPFQDEFYLLDHSTTTAEAAGHTGGNFGKGGDFLYRWGNPAAYDRGTTTDQTLFNQHGTVFIDEGLPGAGNILVFNNQAGTAVGQNYSTVDEIELPSDFTLAAGTAWGPAAPVWTYCTPIKTDLFSSGLSNAERLPNGNTLIDSGRQMGWMFEVTNVGTKVWEYFNTMPNPNALVFQVSYYERTLWAEAETLSTAAGGTVDLGMVAGSVNAGRIYLVLGSVSGTSPGFTFGGETIPLNPDGYFFFTLGQPNSAFLPGSLGTLNATGNAQASFVLGPGQAGALTGTTVHHAFGVLDPITLAATHASNAVPILLTP